MIEKIFYKKKLLAMILPEKKNLKKGVNFLTPSHLTLQLGFIKHKSNTYIKPHTHKNYLRKIKKKYLFSKVVNKNKILILLEGSHGFKILRNCSIIEVKQGPFSLSMDKERFNKIDEKYIKIKK